MLGVEMSAVDGCISEKRDPCASPPCKRLKQAVECIVLDDDAESCNSPIKNQTIISKPFVQLPNQENTHDKQPPAFDKQNIKQCIGTKNCDVTLMEMESSVINDNKDQIDHELPLLCMRRLSEDTGCKTNSSGSPSNLSNSSTTSLTVRTETSPKILKENGTIFKFLQPVTTGSKSTAEHAKTPSRDGGKEPCKRDGVMGTPCTPVNTKESPEMLTNGETPSPATSCNHIPKTTPKRKTPGRKLSVEEKLKREEERLRKQKEKEALEKERLEKRKEKERLRLEAKQKKEQEKIDQLEQKKQREKERIEKKEQEEKEKRERLEKKEEEKRKKEEERKKKEDEKNLKNEEKRKREEGEMLKKQKAKNTFASFFIKKDVANPSKPKEQIPKEAKFQPFELKPFMKLASIHCRKPLSEDAKQRLSKHLVEQVVTSLPRVKEEFIALREVASKIKQEEKQSNVSCPSEMDDENDIMIIDDDISLNNVKTLEAVIKNGVDKVKGKLLQFHENYRPAYFGSWRKKSSSVGRRTPFKKDEDLMNYDVDSDEEWEEEEPGESLSNSEGEDDDETGPNEEDEDQDGFFVPHGYLSDDEGDARNDEEDDMEQDGGGRNYSFSQHDSEDKMQRHIAKQKVWEAEMKRQFKPMKPLAIGCIWEGEIPAILKQLEACCLLSEDSIDPSACMKREHHEPATPSQSTTTYYNTAMPVPEEAMPFLIHMVHGSATGLQKLVRLFRKRWTLEANKEGISEENWETHCTVSKRQVEKKITTIAHKEVRATMPKPRWYVHSNILALYKMENISLPINGLVTASTTEKSPSPVPSQTKSISPTIISFTNAKDNSEKQNGVIINQPKSRDSTLMDTAPPVRLEVE